MTDPDRRSVRQIRSSLERTRHQIESDLTTLGERLEDSLSPVNLVRRHPVLVAAAGAVAGFLIMRRPATLLRTMGRLAGWGAPLLLSALLRSDPGRQTAEPEVPRGPGEADEEGTLP